MSQPPESDVRAAQQRRSIATAIGLIGFVALIFIVTIIKLQGHAINAPN